MKQTVNGVELFIESSGDSGSPLVLVGHVPNLTHPDDYALVVGSFIKECMCHENNRTFPGRKI
jgi:hypothetical protein